MAASVGPARGDAAPLWKFKDVSGATAPSGRLLGGAATLADGRTAVVYGGQDPSGTVLGDTWQYRTSTGWVAACGTTIPNAASPCGPGRRALQGGMASGPSGVVVFGGQDENGVALSDTWVWDGHAWTQVCASGACGPTPRVLLAIAGNGNQVVLFGGLDGGNALSDTWVFDGNTWTQTCGDPLPTACGPGALGGASMAWDGGQFVLFGGAPSTSGGLDHPVDDTWMFNGTAWTKACGTSTGTPCGPPARSLAGFGFIQSPQSQLQGAILAGGGDLFGAGTQRLERDAWFWHTDTWTSLAVPWTSSPVTFPNNSTPPVGPDPLLGVIAPQPTACGVLYLANVVTAIANNNPTITGRTLTAGWDLTGSGEPTGCNAPSTTTTTTTSRTSPSVSSPASTPPTTVAPPVLPATGGTGTTPLTAIALAALASGLIATRANRTKRRLAEPVPR